MGKFEEFRERQLAEKYGIRNGKLETTSEFTFSELQPHVSKWHQEYMDAIRRKYGVLELQIEGQEKPQQRTLADDIRVRDAIEARGSRLVSTVGSYRERPFRVWLEVRL